MQEIGMKVFERVRQIHKETSKTPFNASTTKNNFAEFECRSLRQGSSLERQMKTLKWLKESPRNIQSRSSFNDPKGARPV
jgi:hypothetical protein